MTLIPISSFSMNQKKSGNEKYFCFLFIASRALLQRDAEFIVLESWWSGNEKYFCFLFIASRALLQRDAEFNRSNFN